MVAEVPQTKDRHALSCEAPARSRAFDRAVSKSEERITLFAPVTYSTYLVQFKALQFQAGIAVPLSAHCLRHSFGTLTLEADIPMESIAKMMGPPPSPARKSTPKSQTKRLQEIWTD